MKREREVGDVAAGVARMVRALGRRVGDADPIDLRLLVDLRAAVDDALVAAMLDQRRRFSLAEIADGLGTTRQNVRQRLARATTTKEATHARSTP